MKQNNECLVCGKTIVRLYAHHTCSNDCRKVKENAYRARIVKVQCIVCDKWEFMTYGQMAVGRWRRGGACKDCHKSKPKSQSGASRENYVVPKHKNFVYEEHSPPVFETGEIVWKPAACGLCKHGRPEKQSFLGYDCTAGVAVLCQPKSHQRYFQPVWR